MAKSKEAIGMMAKIYKTKNRRRAKPAHLRGSKKLGPKDSNKGNRGFF